MARQTTFSVPEELGRQLRKRARDKGIPLCDLVAGYLTKDLQESGEPLQCLPFAGVAACENDQWQIDATFFGQHRCMLSLGEGSRLVEAFLQVISDGGAQTIPYAGLSHEPQQVRVARAGAGVGLTLREFKRTMSVTVAREIARDLGACCAELSALTQTPQSSPPAGKTEEVKAPNRTELNPKFGLFA